MFNFDSPDKVLHERMAYEYYGYPADFLERYRAGIEKVTAADVARVAAKYCTKISLRYWWWATSAQFDKPLSSLGAVTDVDITIPPPLERKPVKAAEAAPSPAPAPEEKKASNPEGKELAAKVVQSLGGAEKVNSVKTMKTAFALSSKVGACRAPSSIQHDGLS